MRAPENQGSCCRPRSTHAKKHQSTSRRKHKPPGALLKSSSIRTWRRWVRVVWCMDIQGRCVDRIQSLPYISMNLTSRFPIASRMRSLQPESQRKGSAKAGSVPRRLCSVCVRVDVQSRCCVAETEIAWRCVECNAATSVSAVPPVCQQPKVQQFARGQERMFFAAALDPLSSRLRSLAGVWSLADSVEG